MIVQVSQGNFHIPKFSVCSAAAMHAASSKWNWSINAVLVVVVVVVGRRVEKRGKEYIKQCNLGAQPGQPRARHPPLLLRITTTTIMITATSSSLLLRVNYKVIYLVTRAN